MGKKLPCVLLLLTAMLAGCASGGVSSQPDPSPPPDQPAVVEPVLDKLSKDIFVDDPSSPYPRVEESWLVDMDGDGVDELVELRAEKRYVGNEIEPDKWFESTDYGLHPFTLLVTKGGTVFEWPVSQYVSDYDGGDPILYPWYYFDSAYTSACWTQDQSGTPVLAMWFDVLAAGGMGIIDVYAITFQDGIVSLPVPEFGIEAALDEERMTAQVTVPETGYTETLDLMQWMADREAHEREMGYDFTYEPLYYEDGRLEWPVAPGNIDGHYSAGPAEHGITVRQYIWGCAHMDGMGALVTTISWDSGQAVVLDQYFDWG